MPEEQRPYSETSYSTFLPRPIPPATSPSWKEVLECAALCKMSYPQGALPSDTDFLCNNVYGIRRDGAMRLVTVDIGDKDIWKKSYKTCKHKLVCVVEPFESKNGKQLRIVLADGVVDKLNQGEGNTRLDPNDQGIDLKIPPRMCVLEDMDSTDSAPKYTIVVRGSATSGDWKRDFHISLRRRNDFSEKPLPVHSGFADAAEFLGKIIKLKFPFAKEATWRITGHSLGGAVSALLGAYLVKNGFRKVHQIITFGQPMFTNKKGAEMFNQMRLPLYRVVNEDDLVPTVPTAAIPLFGLLYPYYHCGISFRIECEDNILQFYEILPRQTSVHLTHLKLNASHHSMSDPSNGYVARLHSIVLYYVKSASEESVTNFLVLSPFRTVVGNGNNGEGEITAAIRKYPRNEFVASTEIIKKAARHWWQRWWRFI
mmetsp:Transcript_36294/g.58652  ORF Transcript_36294/g.58652 Transcript_36294/m.58652 type:complete len:427 (-) Transcript_36294:87-1367(-)